LPVYVWVNAPLDMDLVFEKPVTATEENKILNILQGFNANDFKVKR
jgi:hypothetical protein